MYSLTIIFLCIAFATACLLLALSLPCVTRLRRLYSRSTALQASVDAESVDSGDSDANPLHPIAKPSVTILALDKPADRSLDRWLEEVEAQDYSEFNVVVVCDATASDTREISERYAARYPRVRFTFIPPGSHNLSRRKLALTLGIKAADGEYVLTTSTVCRIPSPHWLTLMMASSESPDLVLGTSRPDFESLHGAGKWYRQFDYTLRDAQWIGAAAAVHPFRADGMNLLIRRGLFMQGAGYSRSAYLTYGDDDIFLCQLLQDAPDASVAVQIAPQAVLIPDWGELTDKTLGELKDRYDFTSRYLPNAPFMRNSLISWCQWISTLCGAAGISLPLADMLTQPGAMCLAADVWIPGASGVAILLALWGTEIGLYRRMASVLGAKRLWWAVIPFMHWHPIGNLLFRMRHSHLRHLHFTCRL